MEQVEDFEPGLVTLYEGTNPTVDVIAVHGLGANPNWAWVRKVQAKEGKEKKKEKLVNWLSNPELLPSQIPKSRIMAFNYPSRWHRNAPKQRRVSCAIQLLQAVHSDREGNESATNRPLVFIGHSFGGIVIEQAMVEAIFEPKWEYISRVTVGFIFLGTPHRGTEAAFWGELIATTGEKLGLGSHGSILKDLREDSETLSDMLHKFTCWLFRCTVPVVCFYELYETDYGKRWGISWKQWVVPENSATIDGHKRIGLNADHLKINKYNGPDDASYKSVYPEIKEMVSKGPGAIKTRLNPRTVPRALDDSCVPEQNRPCLQSLILTYPPDDLRAVRRTKGRQVDGTCEWILANPVYVEWVAAKHNQLFCLTGSAGIGKTMIASYLVDQLEIRIKRSESALFSFYFCDNKDERRRTATAIIRGLLVQLLQQQSSFFKYVQPEYGLLGERLCESFETLWRIFVAILSDPEARSTYILIDALDECEEDSKSVLVEALYEFFGEVPKDQSVKVFITHRPGEAISGLLGDIGVHLPVDVGTINPDLERYIGIKVDELVKKKKDLKLKQDLINEIQQKLMEEAGGTFLWVSLVLDYMSKARTLQQFKKRLFVLPPDLETVYKRILLDIDEDLQDTASFILRVVFIARRPLTVRELATACLLGNGNYEKTTLPMVDELVEWESEYKCCGALLLLDEQNKTINLVHQSAKDFLRGSPDLMHQNYKEFAKYYPEADESNFLMFRISWRYFCVDEFENGTRIIKRSGQYLSEQWQSKRWKAQFLGYAASEWMNHLLVMSEESVDKRRGQVAYLRELPNLRDIGLINAAERGNKSVVQLLVEHGADINVRTHGGWTALHKASSNGHEAIVQLLLERSADVNAKAERDEQTALYMAARNGHEAVVRILLEHKANVDAQTDVIIWNYDGDETEGELTALYEAASNGHETILRLLIKHGADVNMKTNFRWTALHGAAGNGHKAVVQLLLEHKVDVNAKTSGAWNSEKEETALHLAASNGHEAVVRVLVEHGADINAKTYRETGHGEGGWTALHKAASNGHKAVVRLLLEQGANISTKSAYEHTALDEAAGNGHEAIVQLLLEHAVDININGGIALRRAANNGHEAVVQLLLEHGANIDMEPHGVWTALYSAVWEGHKAVVQLLIKHGADVNIYPNDWTALSYAAWKGYEAIVQLLLEQGADVSIKSADGWTALHYSASSGYEVVVQLLLQQGAEISTKAVDGKTALHEAASRGNKAVVLLLLEQGAGISEKTVDGRTALCEAANNGHEAVVRLLVEYGANLSAKTVDGKTALHEAANNGHEAVVRLLVEYGADLSAKTVDGKTALHEAASNGHEAVARLLVEYGADVSAKTVDGKTALCEATRYGHRMVVEVLVEHGVGIDAKTIGGWITLHEAARDGLKAIVRLLLEQGTDVNAETDAGFFTKDKRILLHEVASNGHEAVVQLLLQHGADINAQTDDGWMALHAAATHNHKGTVQLLLKHGADISAKRTDGWTALHAAAWNGCEAVVQLLLEQGAAVNAKTEHGETALHKAVWKGHGEIVRLLLEQGADVNAKTKQGNTALHQAISGGHEAVARLLVEHGADVDMLE